VYSYLPFMILPIYGSVEKLDYTLVEAALDLGAGPLAAFRKIFSFSLAMLQAFCLRFQN
jgi:spermidine/putrescine transport system permease protein